MRWLVKSAALERPTSLILGGIDGPGDPRFNVYMPTFKRIALLATAAVVAIAVLGVPQVASAAPRPQADPSVFTVSSHSEFADITLRLKFDQVPDLMTASTLAGMLSGPDLNLPG